MTPEHLLAGAHLAYVSDYFSFVGADDRGRVAFALDNNRGRDDAAEETVQAEHLYAVLHVEHEGWQPLEGLGRYAASENLLEIPDSLAFTFAGSHRSGISIVSATNSLELQVQPLVERLARSDANTVYAVSPPRLVCAGVPARSRAA